MQDNLRKRMKKIEKGVENEGKITHTSTILNALGD